MKLSPCTLQEFTVLALDIWHMSNVWCILMTKTAGGLQQILILLLPLALIQCVCKGYLHVINPCYLLMGDSTGNLSLPERTHSLDYCCYCISVVLLFVNYL